MSSLNIERGLNSSCWASVDDKCSGWQRNIPAFGENYSFLGNPFFYRTDKDI
jgi:hypothetical protein